MEFRTPLTDVISIHAPQWGATCPSSSLLVLVIVFQSTHPSGVRRAPITKVRQARYFNPRTPVGCDLPTAPPLFDANNFNPRTPVGCDSYRHHHNKRFHPFQSTHPSGVRPFDGAKSVGKSSDFNPRTPVGCDRTPPDRRSHSLRFQSTHPSGVRPATPPYGGGNGGFQSTHPSGVRPENQHYPQGWQ